jgi:hypothetical protein
MNGILRLRGEDIDGRNVCCLGSQLAQIVAAVEKYLGVVNWYAADVEVVGPSSLAQGSTSEFVGGSDKLISVAGGIDQFLRGVFLAVSAEKAKPKFREFIDTEDPVDVDLGDALVEIRAFDTTFFEILTPDKTFAGILSGAFHVTPVLG